MVVVVKLLPYNAQVLVALDAGMEASRPNLAVTKLLMDSLNVLGPAVPIQGLLRPVLDSEQVAQPPQLPHS